MKLLHLAARPLLASIFVDAGADTLRAPAPRAEIAGPFLAQVRETFPALPKNDVGLVRLNAGAQVAAGCLLAVGRLPRLSALVLAASLVPTALSAHRFWESDDPQERAGRRVQFAKDTAILGGLLAVTSDAGHIARERAWRNRAKDRRRRAVTG